jgi:hypothetical protein
MTAAGSTLATLSGSYLTPGGDTGGYTASVVRDSSSGKLDFLYQVSADPSNGDNIQRLTAFSFKGFTTNVGYDSGSSGSIVPTEIDRSASGTTVGFNMQLTPGDMTNVLIIKTNADAFVTGNFHIGLTDGGTANLEGFAPQNPVPEPTSILLAGLGLSGVAGCAYRRRKSQVASTK